MKDFINIAKQFLGAKEGGVSHHHIIDGYNSIRPLPRGYRVTYKDAWCAPFVSYILSLAGYDKTKLECSAQRLSKNLGHKVKQGKRNDIIFYDWQSDGWIDHVGIIEDYDEKTKTYTVIEGNYHDSVGIRKIKANSSSIKSISRIYQEDKKTENKAKNNVNNKGSKRITKKLVADVIAGKYGNGTERIEKLKKAGYDPKKVQEAVNKMI